MRVQVVSLFLAGLLGGSGVAADWPQFRGPDGQGHSSARGLPLRWSEKENIRWKTAIPGLGWSSPVIGDGRVWLTTATDAGHSLRAVCVDAASGRLLHDVEVFRVKDPPPINPKNSYASPTPVLDDTRVYVHFGTFGTACLETASGKILWTNQELRLDHKEGPGSSPILCGDHYNGFSNTPRPVFGHGLVFLCTGYMHPQVWAVRPDGKGDVTKTHVVWREARQAPASPSPLLVDDLLYTVTDLSMISARTATTGRLLWSERLGGPVTASPLYADGRLYSFDEAGKTSVLRPGPKFELLARNSLDGRVLASPAVAGRALFLRTDSHLYRIEERGK